MKSNLLLRALEPEDIDLLYRYENDRDIWLVSGTTAPYSRYVLKKYIENSFADIYETRQLRLIIEKLGEAIGSVDIFDFDAHNSHAGVGVIIFDSSERGKGYAKEAIGLLINYCFKTLSLNQIYCNITTDNHASFALFQSLGFREIGVRKEWMRIDDKYIDVAFLQLLKTDIILK